MLLTDSVIKLPKVGPVYIKRLEKLGIKTISDLLSHPPSRYIDYRQITPINQARLGQNVTVKGTLKFIKNQYSKTGKVMQLAEIEDGFGKMKILWFNQPYLVMSLKKNLEMYFSGKIEPFGREKAMISPESEVGDTFIHTGRLLPVYPETYGVSSKWLRSKIAYVLKFGNISFEDYIPEEDLKKYSLIDIKNATHNLHFPTDDSEHVLAKKRFSFNEFLSLTLQSIYRKDLWKKNRALHTIKIECDKIEKFINRLPFSLTGSQKQSIDEIFSDFQKNVPMNRLLEGDVGSGKTVVAATAIYAVFLNGYKSIIMAPTQILAKQHFETLNKLFDQCDISIKLVTSASKKNDVSEADVYVGTHALIHRLKSYEKAALVVIDEQHRFGVNERSHLVKGFGSGNKIPHTLTMTATPIPRTIALTTYGDLDLSVLKDMPKGRIPVSTWVVSSKKRKPAYEWIKEQIDNDHIQVFIIYPLIDESEYETLKSIKAAVKEFENIKKVFDKYRVDILHGRLKEEQKNLAIENFRSGKTDILVSTPVVEVGIDVPNATIMVIEAAERFGLAQLHQLRGRVGRGLKKSYCILLPTSSETYISERLDAMRRNHSGFELAEIDLKIRGPGQIFGTAQHGFFELKNASWSDTDLIKTTKEYSDHIISNKNNYGKLIKHIIGEGISLN